MKLSIVNSGFCMQVHFLFPMKGPVCSKALVQCPPVHISGIMDDLINDLVLC